MNIAIFGLIGISLVAASLARTFMSVDCIGNPRIRPWTASTVWKRNSINFLRRSPINLRPRHAAASQSPTARLPERVFSIPKLFQTRLYRLRSRSASISLGPRHSWGLRTGPAYAAYRRVCATGLVDPSTSGSNSPSTVKVLLGDRGNQNALTIRRDRSYRGRSVTETARGRIRLARHETRQKGALAAMKRPEPITFVQIRVRRCVRYPNRHLPGTQSCEVEPHQATDLKKHCVFSRAITSFLGFSFPNFSQLRWPISSVESRCRVFWRS